MQRRTRFVLSFLFAVAPWMAGQSAATRAEPDVPPPSAMVLEQVPPVPQGLAETIAPYAEYRAATLLSWHPQRREMLVATRFGNTAQVHAVARPGGERRQLTFYDEPVNQARYEPKFGSYFVFSKDVGGGEFYQLYRYDVASGRVAMLTDGRSRNVSPRLSWDGRRMAWGSTRRDGNDVDLWTMEPGDPSTARMLLAMQGGGLNVSDWSPDGRSLLIVDEVSINESYVYLVDSTSGQRTPLTPKRGAETVSWSEPRFSADGAKIYVVTDKGSEFQRLCRMDRAGRVEACLTEGIPWDVERFDLSRDGRYVAFSVNENGASRLHVRTLADGREVALPALPAGELRSLEFHENSRDLGFSLTNVRSPGDAYSIDLGDGSLHRWTESETGGVNTESFREPELVTWRSFDGRAISGFLYMPPATFAGRRPVVINIHGGPEGQSRPGFLGANNYMVERLGVAMIFPNVRGSTGYGRSYTLLDNGVRREGAVRDIGALLDWIRTRPELDADRVMITGGSYGGYMTLMAATAYNDRIRCSLDVVGMSSLVTFLEHTSGYRRDLRRVEYGDERDPGTRAFLERTAPIHNATKITKPIFIVQGLNDPRVPYTESERMAATVRGNGTPVWFMMAKDEGHGFQKKANRDYLLDETVLFMQTYLLR